MLATTTLSLFLALAAHVASLPTETSLPAASWTISPGTGEPHSSAEKRDELEKRALGGVYICTDINWGGTCGYAVQPTYTCIDMGTDWDKKISSFGPDSGTQCVLYNTHGCLPDYATYPNGQPDVYYPGKSDLRTININDAISSFRCYPS